MINANASTTDNSRPMTKHSFILRAKRDVVRYKYIYIMLLPLIVFYILFHYIPMYGALMAFQDFVPIKGVLGSKWIGFENFARFFSSPSFALILRNTFVISVSSIIFGFPAPIILALLINEIKGKKFRSLTQTISYLPHFVSLVIICGMVKEFTMNTGIVNTMLSAFGFKPVTMLQVPGLFVPIYVISDIWQHVGWNSIIYIAALTAIDQELYEAAKIDGANRFKQILHITLPGISSTIVVLLILRIGNILNVGFEKIFLLYNPAIYDTADVISTYVYRAGILDKDWSFSAAAGLFNSVINFAFVISANYISRKVQGEGLW